MSIQIHRATENNAPALCLIGSLAYAQDKLFNIFQAQKRSTTSRAEQEATYLAWRTERSRNRIRGEGKAWFKAVDSRTGLIVGFTGVFAPEVYNSLDDKSGEVPEGVNERLLDEGAKTKAMGREKFLEGREDVCYVPSMVVHPDHQGRGIGTLLLNEVCKIADGSGQDVYLEATPAGKKLYLNAGFEELGSLEALDGKYVLTFMLRKAKKL